MFTSYSCSTICQLNSVAKEIAKVVFDIYKLSVARMKIQLPLNTYKKTLFNGKLIPSNMARTGQKKSSSHHPLHPAIQPAIGSFEQRIRVAKYFFIIYQSHVHQPGLSHWPLSWNAGGRGLTCFSVNSEEKLTGNYGYNWYNHGISIDLGIWYSYGILLSIAMFTDVVLAPMLACNQLLGIGQHQGGPISKSLIFAYTSNYLI